MPARQIHTVSGVGTPWGDGETAFLEQLEGVVPFDSFVLGLIDPRAPQVDALLAAAGVDAEALQQWCTSDFRQDPTLRDARRRGLAEAQTRSSEPGPPLPADHQVLVHLLPISPQSRHAWYLALGRRDEGFDETEQQRTALVLRALQVASDAVDEAGLGRLFLGADGRLIHSDPATEAEILEQPQLLSELARILPAVVEQRWPKLADDAVHDMALTLAGQPRWVRFHRARALSDLEMGHWYLELRPLDPDDIPPVGVIDDERVAQAVAYLSDHYAQAPTLSDVADAVHTSPFHFHRLFVRHVGRSPKHYLLRMQLMIAKWMLRATRTSIGEIAQATGFASHGHFTATFHRMVGVSPSQFRETR